jgi:hypothetical protein
MSLMIKDNLKKETSDIAIQELTDKIKELESKIVSIVEKQDTK